MLVVARGGVLSSIMIMSPCVSFPFSVPAQSPTELWCNSPVVILLVVPVFSATTLHNQHNLVTFLKTFLTFYFLGCDKIFKMTCNNDLCVAKIGPKLCSYTEDTRELQYLQMTLNTLNNFIYMISQFDFPTQE